MYIHDDRLAPKLDQSTFGIGGKLAVESGDWYGLKVKAAYYVTNDLGLRSSNPKKTDAYIFDVDKRPYSILGEASLEYKNGVSTLLFGRQEIDTPIVSTYDYRIIPNLFEAYTYTNTAIPNTAITLSYITKMSGLDGLVSFKHFESMSQQTYTSLAMSDLNTVDSNDGDTLDISKISGDQGVLMSGITYENSVKIQGWNYYCNDVLNEFYVDLAYPYTINSDLDAIFEIQGYAVREIGRFQNFLQNFGLNGSYELFGSKISLENKNLGLTTSVAYNFFTGDAKTVTAFGNWGGYPEYVAVPYMFAQDTSVSALAKSQMGKINLKVDLAKVGLANHTMIAGYSIIDLDEQIMPQSDIKLINLIYKAKVNNALNLKGQYEIRSSDNYRYANDMLTLSLTYKF
ncbi:hypothetical protein [Sulfuricurvum sp.]|uniref:hypothetical protein n=1 Tax=Sulfuricurvum sp. TaxID=2025608 RepID=UPI00286E1263|nr:hypothetical protein [Sulfuricurvum sp.]